MFRCFKWLTRPASLTLLLMLCACGRSEAGSPEALIARWLDDARSGDAEAFRGAFPSPAEAGALFDCPADRPIAERFSAPNPDFVAWKSLPPTLLGTTRVLTEEVAAGAAIGPCRARRAMTLSKLDAVVREGEAERTLLLRVASFDGRHRLLGY